MRQQAAFYTYGRGHVVLAVLILLTFMLTAVIGCNSGSDTDSSDLTLRKQIAGELRDNKLFASAITEYESILSSNGLSLSEQANLNYLIARVYFENIKDYQQAAAYYLRARAYDPEGSFMNEASRNLVASLQKIGNLIDAKRELSSNTDIDYKPQSDSDLPVARIDGRPVYRSQIENDIASLPSQIQKQLLTPEAKVGYVRQYVGTELLYLAASRENYLSNPEIVKQLEELTKKLIVDRYLYDRVIPKADIDTVDVNNFYLAHKTDMYNDKPYNEVRGAVYADYQRIKAEAAYTEYINRLAQTENVEFLDQNWR